VIIGIDLGTTNSALACAAGESVEVFSIPQLIAPGEVGEEPVLPSFLFVPGPADFPPGSTALPWDPAPTYVAGVLAQRRGAENASRLISSAKSWLCHAGVDRTAALLPPAAPDGVPRLSPIDASRHYLEHLQRAWDWRHADLPFDQQQLLVTVPASFDAVARELTQRAAAEAGYRNLVLLEEPQAAFYAWIERHPDWRERVRPGDLILVIDIGGGTTDFTLIAVRDQQGELVLERVAVGDHILLGGDNMDLALARHLESQLGRLNLLQLHQLWQRARLAKEQLLEEGSRLSQAPVTILGTGTGLVGGTLRAKLLRADLNQILVEGFFPEVGPKELPQQARRVALQEIGLPYASDPAITRHLAQFLAGQQPTHVLFNGGVLRAKPIRERLLAVLNSWLSKPVTPLIGEDLLHAVARGAAYYGLARQGRGVRIRGGAPRTYYIGIEMAMPAVPGLAPPLKPLAVAPFGMEEGTDLRIPGREFGLVTGAPAEFRFFASSHRKEDGAGLLLEEVPAELEELAPIEVTLPGNPGEFVPVSLEAVLTETGVLELWCVARDGRRWKLEFNLRARS
jgi:molecular chaperone DnaK (HSP70)